MARGQIWQNYPKLLRFMALFLSLVSARKYGQKGLDPLSSEVRAHTGREETKGRFCKRAVLANGFWFRRSAFCALVQVSLFCPRSVFCTLDPFFCTLEHPPKPPFGKPPFCEPPKGRGPGDAGNFIRSLFSQRHPVTHAIFNLPATGVEMLGCFQAPQRSNNQSSR